MKKELLSLVVNGRPYEIACPPNKLLLDVLREDLNLTGSKRGCDDSSCGACTVAVDGQPMLACTLLAVSCEGRQITTVEGITEHGSLAAIQKAFGLTRHLAVIAHPADTTKHLSTRCCSRIRIPPTKRSATR